MRQACDTYFGIAPFVLQAGVKTGMKINYRNPLEVGADRIAGAMGAMHAYPDRNILVASFGTATTFCALRKDKTYLGGAIMPGVRVSQEALVGQRRQAFQRGDRGGGDGRRAAPPPRACRPASITARSAWRAR